MDICDYSRLAQALAKASLQPGVDAISVEECIYQIGLVLAREARPLDLEAWQREIREWRVVLSAVAEGPSAGASACSGPGA